MRKRLLWIANFEGVYQQTNFGQTHITRIINAHSGDLRSAIGALQAASYMPIEERESFTMSLSHSDIDASRILRLLFKEKAYDEVMDMIKSVDVLSLIEALFDYGISTPANTEAKLVLIDAAITSRRDLLMGVEDVYVKHNFVRMLLKQHIDILSAGEDNLSKDTKLQ